MSVKTKHLRGEASVEAIAILKTLKAKTGLNQPQIMSSIVESLDVELGLLLLAPYIEKVSNGELIADTLSEDAELKQQVAEAKQVIKDRLINELETMKPEVLLQIRKLMGK